MKRIVAAALAGAAHSLPRWSAGAILSLAAIPTIAAPQAGEVDVIAKDALGRPLANAKVKLETSDGKVVGEATSGADGRATFEGIVPGVYAVTGEETGFEAATAVVTLEAGAGASAELTLAAQAALNLEVIAKQLEAARLSIQPQIGASTYTLTSQTIATQPGGNNNQINQVLLQAPGVAQDNLANGALHVRNEHLNVQYRINGIIIPEGASFFGQGLTPRFVNSLQLITGALPAEYGLRTAGIVDIQTKTGLFAPGGSVGIYGGSYGTIQPSFEYGGNAGGYNYYVAGDYLESDHGLEGVTRKYNQLHDTTQQYHEFAYLDKVIDAASKVTFMGGLFHGRFEIPNNPGQPSFFPSVDQKITGIPTSAFASANLNERQTEDSDFAIASYLRAEQDLSFQVSAFSKYSSLHFHPDGLGDLNFSGISEDALRTSWASGIQADASYKLVDNHTLRAGVLVTGERVSAKLTAQVLPQLFDGTGAPVLGSDGNPLFSPTPTTIVDGHAKTGWTYSAYLQDEWKIVPTLTLNYGGRFDVVNEFAQANQISPRANVVWQATPSTTLHAGYANYFTPPPFELVSTTSIGLFANTSGAPNSTGNSPVKPERTQYFDVGIAQEVIPGLTIGVDAYYKYAHDLIDESQFGAPVILTPFNYRVGRNQGVELTTAYVNGPFSAYGNLALAVQKGKNINSAQFNFTPDDLAFSAAHAINTDHTQIMTASGGVSYLWRDTRFSVDMIAGSGVRTTRANDHINGGTVPSYEQVNLGVSHRFEDAPGGPLTVRLDLINVFDEIYLIRSQLGTGVSAPQFGPRRSVFAGISKEF
jgi:outer membrane receptor protein involved in Fe transport